MWLDCFYLIGPTLVLTGVPVHGTVQVTRTLNRSTAVGARKKNTQMRFLACHKTYYVILKWLTSKAQDILSPDCRWEKNRAQHKYKKRYSDNGLSDYTVSSLKAVRHRYNYSFCIYGVLDFFSACSSSLEFTPSTELTPEIEYFSKTSSAEVFLLRSRKIRPVEKRSAFDV